MGMPPCQTKQHRCVPRWPILAHEKSPVTQALLPQMKYNRNFPLSSVYGPSKLLGAGYPDLYIEQGTLHIELLLRHYRSQQGPMYKCRLVTKSDRLALEHNVWCTNAPPTPPNTRMDPSDQQLSTRQSMPTQPSRLTVQPIREHNFALICTARSNKKYTATEINAINKCRIYMQAETLSDIYNIQGTALDNQVIYHFHKNPDPFTLLNPTLWSKQAPPGPKQWKIWNKFVHQEFTTSTKSNTLW